MQPASAAVMEGAGGSITINGGKVEAKGLDAGAGIGGGNGGDGGTITINGGTVTAKGGDIGAGIGGGNKGAGGTIIITGGMVTAKGKDGGAGIGGGIGGAGGNLTISGGTVTVTGGSYAAGIGNGYTVGSGEDDSGGSTTISGGTVEATNIDGGFGIKGTFSTTTKDEKAGQAVIVASGIYDKSQKEYWSGIIFEGSSGQLYGSSVTPIEDFTIPADSTLTIPKGKTLTIDEGITMTNDGTIINNGKIINKGTITNNGTIEGNQPIVPATGVTLDKTSLTLTEGESAQLTATVMPENATNKAVTWESSNTDVATVDADGTVTAVNAGTATITATAGEAEATCTVTVEADEPPFSGHYTYPVNVAETEHGSILLAKENHYAADGEKVAFTVVPDEGYATDTVTVTTKAGKDVAVTDEGEGIYTFTMPTSEVTLAATFVETEEPEPELPFTDVSEDDWFYDPVRWAFLEGLMTGTSDTEFSPNLATTRGMIVSVLYRLEGNPDLSDDILGYPYEDVNPDDWYAMPVYWARLHGIVSGYSDSQFGPNDAITREQLAAILMNYADYKGMDVSARADLSAYSDADTISSWATDTMQWAVAEGYISGMTADTLEPQGSATRAQVASIFQRFLAE